MDILNQSEPHTIFPPPLTRINFRSATAFVRKIILGKKIIQLSKTHRGRTASMDDGWLIIDQQWHVSPQTPTRASAMADVTGMRKHVEKVSTLKDDIKNLIHRR